MVKKIAIVLAVIIGMVGVSLLIGYIGFTYTNWSYDNKKLVFNANKDEVLESVKLAGFKEAWIDTNYLYFYKDEDKVKFDIDERTYWNFLENIDINNTEEITKILTVIMPFYDKQFTEKDAEKIIDKLFKGNTDIKYAEIQINIFVYSFSNDSIGILYNGNK